MTLPSPMLLTARRSCNAPISTGCRILSTLSDKELNSKDANIVERCISAHNRPTWDGLCNINSGPSEGQLLAGVKARTRRLCHRRCTVIPCLLSQRNYSMEHQHHHKPSGKTYYEILGVTPQCSKTKIKQAYYRLSKVYHPDINKSEAAHKKFQEISEAYEVLYNAHKREQYDKDHRRRAHHGTEKTTRFGQKRYQNRGTPPTGRSNVYNFDEWYKQHYYETLKRDHADRMKKQRFDNVVQDQEKFSEGGEERAFQALGLTACLAVFLLFLFRK